MKIGFAGAHRTGKTTLATIVAECFGQELTQGSCTPAFVNVNRKPSDDLTFLERFAVQRDILSRYRESVNDKPTFFIDRTGLDFIAYTSAELSTNSYKQLSDDIIEEVNAYIADCMEEAAKLDVLFIVQPGVAIVNDDSKAICDAFVINKINSLIVGYAHQMTAGNVFLIDADIVDLDARVKVVLDILNEGLNEGRYAL